MLGVSFGRYPHIIIDLSYLVDIRLCLAIVLNYVILNHWWITLIFFVLRLLMEFIYFYAHEARDTVLLRENSLSLGNSQSAVGRAQVKPTLGSSLIQNLQRAGIKSVLVPPDHVGYLPVQITPAIPHLVVFLVYLVSPLMKQGFGSSKLAEIICKKIIVTFALRCNQSNTKHWNNLTTLSWLLFLISRLLRASPLVTCNFRDSW